MIAYYGYEISPNQLESAEGFLICKNVPIARTGPMEYTARDLQLDGDPDRLITVNRYPEDVFEPAALASFEGKPVTDGHPIEEVEPSNYTAYLKGHVQNVRAKDNFVVADLYINDSSLINDIKNGVKREVSCGYLCTYVPDGNQYKQTKIRGNHVAVVPRGRAGVAVSIKDAAASAEKGHKNMSKLSKAILSAFGAAARDAAPEEMGEMIDAAAEALEAVPADKAPEAAPATDVEVERAPKGDDLGTKLDKLIEMVAELRKKNDREEKMERKLSDESDLDEMIEKLAGGEELPEDKEEAVTVKAETMEDACVPGEAKDAAIAMLKKVRPAIAAIKDKHERAKVTDALLSAFKATDTMQNIMAATASHANDSKVASYEDICKAQKDAYDSRNPHKQK